MTAKHTFRGKGKNAKVPPYSGRFQNRCSPDESLLHTARAKEDCLKRREFDEARTYRKPAPVELLSHPQLAGASISALARAGGYTEAPEYCNYDYPGSLLANWL
jgi:hypothetical protein